jgi:hypothetical protein
VLARLDRGLAEVAMAALIWFAALRLAGARPIAVAKLIRGWLSEKPFPGFSETLSLFLSPSAGAYAGERESMEWNFAAICKLQVECGCGNGRADEMTAGGLRPTTA